MIESQAFVEAIRRRGFGLVSGVPCSYLTPLINGVINSAEVAYVNAANEGEAVAIATGATLGGLGGIVMFQNSGLGNAVSPLTSLNWVFQIPVLIITTWRGQPGGPPDEPQHGLMGSITEDQLKVMEIPFERFPRQLKEVDSVLRSACDHMNQTGRPYALVMEKGRVAPTPLMEREKLPRSIGGIERAEAVPAIFDQDEVLCRIQASVSGEDIVVATAGFTGRALYSCGDLPNQFYMVGSMGCVSTFGLGLALAQPQKRVVVIDGDGAFLMRLGALAAVGGEQPVNLLHIVLNNGVHDSTGSQATLAAHVDIPGAAVACGYPRAIDLVSLDRLGDEVCGRQPGLRLLHLRTQPRRDRKLLRPSIEPAAVARRLQGFMGVKGRAVLKRRGRIESSRQHDENVCSEGVE
ncbi:MAG: hypothetical protein M2R45_01984 [Verrucomicrobia subdivision 3 bacterium]|nr:hypothetical protein [Limisphaerales bacterium]MCS1416149.1 hypothetical protein [Limisphaerales bacterium]